MNAYQKLTMHKSVSQSAKFSNRSKDKTKTKGFTLNGKVSGEPGKHASQVFAESVKKDGVSEYMDNTQTELGDGSKDTYAVKNKTSEETPLSLQVAMALEMMGFAPAEEKEKKGKKEATAKAEETADATA